MSTYSTASQEKESASLPQSRRTAENLSKLSWQENLLAQG